MRRRHHWRAWRRMRRAMPRNRIAAAIRINTTLFVAFVDVVRGAVSGAMTTGSTTAKASPIDARVGAGACATIAAAGGGEAATVATIAASGTAGAAEATGVGSGLLGTDDRVGATANATGLDELLEEDVGRGVIVAPIATRGVTTIPLLGGSVGLTSSVGDCVVGVAVGDGTVVGVLVAGPAMVEIGP